MLSVSQRLSAGSADFGLGLWLRGEVVDTGMSSRIVTHAHRYKRPPGKRKPQPPLPMRIVTAKTPGPIKRWCQGHQLNQRALHYRAER